MNTHKPTVEQEIKMKIMKTNLFKAMKSSGNYENDDDIVNVILEMRSDVRDGDDPEEVLHDEGFEPDYIYDLL